jgi:CheY-like chemotaxis protein
MPFDLTLMDMPMRTLDCLKAARLLRKAGHVLPFVAMTANADVEDRLACPAAAWTIK